MEKLITLVLQGESTVQQLQEVKSWIEESEENRDFFESYETAYFVAPSTERSFDAAKAWKKVNDRINPKRTKILFLTNWRTWAAALVIGVLGAWVLNIMTAESELNWKADNARMIDVLPNGVGLTLNPGSTAQYEENEAASWVELKGEGYFDVKHKQAKQFFIKTNEVIIRDIGTAFHVRNILIEDTMFFHVDEGMIVCYSGKSDSLRIAAGQGGYYCRSTKRLGARLPQPNQSSYATKVLTYEEVELASVIADLQNVYETSIVVSNLDMMDCTISVSFNNQSIDEIMEIIAMTMNWKVERPDNGWILIGQPCSNPL